MYANGPPDLAVDACTPQGKHFMMRKSLLPKHGAVVESVHFGGGSTGVVPLTLDVDGVPLCSKGGCTKSTLCTECFYRTRVCTYACVQALCVIYGVDEEDVRVIASMGKGFHIHIVTSKGMMHVSAHRVRVNCLSGRARFDEAWVARRYEAMLMLARSVNASVDAGNLRQIWDTLFVERLVDTQVSFRKNGLVRAPMAPRVVVEDGNFKACVCVRVSLYLLCVPRDAYTQRSRVYLDDEGEVLKS